MLLNAYTGKGPGSSVVERVLGKDEVAGSTPVSGSIAAFS